MAPGAGSGSGSGLGGQSARWHGGVGRAHHPSHAAVPPHQLRVLRAHDHAVRADRRTPADGPRSGEDRLQTEERSTQAVVSRGERGELLGALRLQEVRKQVPTADVGHNVQWRQRGAAATASQVQPPPSERAGFRQTCRGAKMEESAAKTNLSSSFTVQSSI